ncbi:MAG TPA: AAA family ATPase, partial [Candidatus Binataceae bacterium]|nr:AAA family ATPase [Candidatus Binataceae bacterium]
MGRLVVIANQKGGVGKTTTTINLAVALAAPKRPILVVDLDPQGNATSGLTPPASLAEIKSSGKTIYEAIVNRVPLKDAIRSVRDHVSLIPSGPDLVGAEVELATIEGRERRLKEVLAPVRNDYAFVLVDTPPSLGMLTLNALVAADSIMVPMQCEYYALEGLSALLDTINRVRKVLNPELRIYGLVLTMFDARNRLSHEIAREVNRHFPEQVFQSVIPRNVRLSESPSHGLSVLEYDSKSAGADAYRALANEVLARAGASETADVSRETSETSQPRRSWSLRALFA